MLSLCSNYRKPETFYCWSTKSLKTCRFAQLLNAYVNYVEHSRYRHFFAISPIFFSKQELSTVSQKVQREREESRRRIAEKDKLLSKRALQINSLQGVMMKMTATLSTL